MPAKYFFIAWFGGLLIGLGLGPATATSVREVSLQEMLAQAELIFEGEVIHTEVEETADYRRPFTRITFRVRDVIKGRIHSPTIRLDFLGGQIGGKHLQVGEIDYPEPGEHGVYFVESLSRRQVHPLYGWSQGRFVIHVDDSGQLRVRTADGRPVVRLEFDLNDQSAGLSRGVAKGILTRRDALSGETLSLDDFKGQLRRHLEMSR